LACAFTSALFCVACVPDPAVELLPVADFAPPAILEAGPKSRRLFFLRFDEEVRPVESSFALDPGGIELSAKAQGAELELEASSDLLPGSDYRLTGEAEDERGNRVRFFFEFVGYNEKPAELRLSELQTAKNSSASKPHRDFVEFEAIEAGNLGGIELSWASQTKLMNYRFPSVEAAKGEFIVLHLAPEGGQGEVDETGENLALASGVDARSFARDFWSGAGGLPDQSGLVLVRARPGSPARDGLFYASEDKAGALGTGKLAPLLEELSELEIWPLAGKEPSYEDGFRWKHSNARSIQRIAGITADPKGEMGFGPRAWTRSASGGQSPGAENTLAAAEAKKP